MSLTPPILNKALQAYIATFPVRSRLDEHLTRQGLLGQGHEIASELDSLVALADRFLWDYPGGVPWDEAFLSAFRAQLVARHPWMDEDSFRTIQSYSRWLCWHEGLNASGT